MTKDNIILELLDLLNKTYTKPELVNILINNGFMTDDFLKIGYGFFTEKDIKDGVSINFGKEIK
jgi:hypothetical protein